MGTLGVRLPSTATTFPSVLKADGCKVMLSGFWAVFLLTVLVHQLVLQ